MNPTLPQELVLLQRSVRKIVDDRLAPLSKQIEERDEIPRDVLESARAAESKRGRPRSLLRPDR